jgi:hypothetical protein
MKSDIKIIRAYWGDSEKLKNEIPPLPIYDNQIVYVWGENNDKFLRSRGFKTRIVTDDDPCKIDHKNSLIRKLIAIKMALDEFHEIMFIDWDCYILRELDDSFYKYISDKPTQIPLYAHLSNPIDGIEEFYVNCEPEHVEFKNEANRYILKYSWKSDDMCILPNFGFFYSREISIGRELLRIAVENDLKGCADEAAMFIYANCDLEEYIKRYHPIFVNGVSDIMTSTNFKISEIQKRFNSRIKDVLNMDPYLEHM